MRRKFSLIALALSLATVSGFASMGQDPPAEDSGKNPTSQSYPVSMKAHRNENGAIAFDRTAKSLENQLAF